MPEGQPLAGKHALVTGGGRGIGYAIAHDLLALGAHVTITGRNPETLTRAKGSLDAGDRLATVTGDVSDRASLDTTFARAREHFGSIAILVNNAGQASSAGFSRIDDALWQRMLDVNLTGTFLGTQNALPDMLAANWGRIVNVASTAGLRGYAYVAAYCAAKHGVIGLTRALALELATKGVTVNAVCPGYTETDIVKETVEKVMKKTGRSEAEARAELTKFNPQGRLVTSEEVAEAVAWLCLPGSASVTGQSIAIAGGEVM